MDESGEKRDNVGHSARLFVGYWVENIESVLQVRYTEDISVA